MVTDAALFEEVVRRVMLALRTPSAPRLAAGAGQEPAVSCIAEPVIAQKLLEQATNGSTTIRLSSRALLTPAARDFIRERGLHIVRDGQPANREVLRWQVCTSTNNAQLREALMWLKTIGSSTSLRITGTPEETAIQAIALLCRGEAAGVLVFTEQPEVTACLANRHERVCAAVVGSAATVSRLRQSWQPNLLAIDPRGQSQSDLKQLLKAAIAPQ